MPVKQEVGGHGALPRCLLCNKEFTNVYGLRKHQRLYHEGDQIAKYSCFVCHSVHESQAELLHHFDLKHKQGTAYIRTSSALSGQFNVFSKDYHHDVDQDDPSTYPFELLCESSSTEEMVHVMSNHLSRNPSYKASLIISCLFRRSSNVDELPAIVPLRTQAQWITLGTNLLDVVHHFLVQINERIDALRGRGSGFVCERVLFSQLEFANTGALNRFSHEGPLLLDHLGPGYRHLINLRRMEKDRCFESALAAALHYDDAKNAKLDPLNSQNRIYKAFYDSINTTGIEFPISIEGIRSFLKLNAELNIIINIYCIYENKVFPAVLGLGSEIGPRDKKHRKKIINLLSIDILPSKDSLFGTSNHLIPIRKFDHFCAKRYPHNGQRYVKWFCYNCLESYSSEEKRNHHYSLCSRGASYGQIEKFPKPNSHVFWEDNDNQYLAPLTGFFDFEAILTDENEQTYQPCGGTGCGRSLCKCSQDELSVNRKIISQHVDVCFSFVLIDQDGVLISEHSEVVTKERAGVAMIKYLLANQETWIAHSRRSKKMVLTEEDKRAFHAAEFCHHCKKAFKEIAPVNGIIKCMDHNHYNGKFIAAACFRCNFSRASNKQFKINCFGHNAMNYDANFLLSALGQFPEQIKTMKAIPTSSEKFKQFEFSNFVIKDSLAFLPGSLREIVADMHVRKQPFPILRQSYLIRDPITNKIDETRFNMIQKSKGHFPFCYVKSPDRLLETMVPSRLHFQSDLSNELISQEDYDATLDMFEHFQMENIGHWMRIYNHMDSLQLADAFHNMRMLLFGESGLDPAKFVGLPAFGLSWYLKSSGVKIELLSDPEMYYMAERALRGGITYLNKRYFKNTDPAKQHCVMIDANNLYGDCLSKKLPLNNYKWVDPKSFGYLMENITKFDMSDPIAYYMDVDVEIPVELHDKLNSMPPFASMQTVTWNMLSKTNQEIYTEIHSKPNPNYESRKMLLSLDNKENYVIHSLLLKDFVQLGCKIRKINRAFSFHHDYIARDFVRAMSARRARFAKKGSKLYQRIMKLINNSYVVTSLV